MSQATSHYPSRILLAASALGLLGQGDDMRLQVSLKYSFSPLDFFK